MKSIDKLRDCTFIGSGKVNEYLDEIEAEIAERYMLLPVDADGVPIHCGERMRLDNGHEGDVWLVGVFDIMMSDHTCFDWAKSRHVKPRTVEDVLREFADKHCQIACSSDFKDCERKSALANEIAEYADELRDLLDGDCS